MDQDRFDSLAKSPTSTSRRDASRRTVVKGGIFALVGSVIGSVAVPRLTRAAQASPTAESTTSASEILRFEWAATGGDAGSLNTPNSLGIDPQGRIWVTSLPGKFLVFDESGTLLESWGKRGAVEGNFRFSGGGLGSEGEFVGGAIAFRADGGFYVTDPGNVRIQEFDANREFVRSWGSLGDADGQFHVPGCVAIERDGSLLVSDLGRNDVQRFSPEGAFIDKFGAPGSGDGQLSLPMCLAVAPDDTIWVPDGGNGRIEVFTPDGSFQRTVGGPGEAYDGLLPAPNHVAFDGQGNAFVANARHNLIQVFDLNGNFLFDFAGSGTEDGRFNVPVGVAVANDRDIYVVELYSNRLQKLTIVGEIPEAGAAATPAP